MQISGRMRATRVVAIFNLLQHADEPAFDEADVGLGESIVLAGHQGDAVEEVLAVVIVVETQPAGDVVPSSM